jgi:FixJ family two-component response regulator
MMPQSGTVFVVDDDASVRRGLERLLRSAGYRAEAFASAAEFLRRGEEDGPSCLVLDIRMPDVTGLELRDALLMGGRDLPIIFVTGHGDIPMAVQAMKAGAVDFLTKPFDQQILLDAVAQALARDATRWAGRQELSGVQRLPARSGE